MARARAGKWRVETRRAPQRHSTDRSRAQRPLTSMSSLLADDVKSLNRRMDLAVPLKLRALEALREGVGFSCPHATSTASAGCPPRPNKNTPRWLRWHRQRSQLTQLGVHGLGMAWCINTPIRVRVGKGDRQLVYIQVPHRAPQGLAQHPPKPPPCRQLN